MIAMQDLVQGVGLPPIPEVPLAQQDLIREARYLLRDVVLKVGLAITGNIWIRSEDVG
jgi:hypothetical protein